MAAIRSAKFTTPDGVERDGRFTKASQYRIGTEKAASGNVADYFIAWATLFDEDGNPPTIGGTHPRAGQAMTAKWLGENLSPADTPKLLAYISEVTTGAVIEKKTLEMIESKAAEETERLAGLINGLSLESISKLRAVPQVPNGSPANSGGSRRKSSKRSAAGSPINKESPMSARA